MTSIPHADPIAAKTALRRELRRRRMSLPQTYRRAAHRAVVRHASRLLARGRRIGAYIATGSELDLSELLAAADERGASLYLPIIPLRARRLWFARLGDEDLWYLHPRYRIPEYAGPQCRAEQLDVLLVPLVGVDAHGYRLGQGGGFYDATLAFRRRHHGRKPLLVGVAYDCQRVDAVPREHWDVRLDYLLTESGLHRFPR